MAKENKCQSVPSCKKCKQKHPTCLHKENANEAEIQTPKASVSCTGASNAEIIHLDEVDATAKCTSVCSIEGKHLGHDQSLIVPIWVSSSNDDQCILTYTLVDCQSNAGFITDQLRQMLKVDGVESHVRLSTMHKEDELIQCKKVQCLVVTDLKRQVSISLPKVYTRNSIPYKPSQIPKPEVAMQWDHLNRIASELMPYRDDIEVGLLIGTNCPKAIKPREVIPEQTMIHMVSKLTLDGVLLAECVRFHLEIMKTRLEVGRTELHQERRQALPWRLGRRRSYALRVLSRYLFIYLFMQGHPI